MSPTASPVTEKAFIRGTHRTRRPGETCAWLADLLPLVGITRVADVTGLDVLGIPVFQAIRPASRNLSVSQGKGIEPMAARASAAMEAVELWHAECLDHVPQTRMTIREMRYSNAFDLETLRWVPGVRYPNAMPLAWIRTPSLNGGRAGWLPREMLELDFTRGAPFVPQVFAMSSNGLASGNCLEEALVHALCELVERHALFLAAGAPDARVAVNPDSVETHYCSALIDRIESADMKLAIYDLSWEAGLACVQVSLAAPDLPHAWMGAGCHPSRDVALSRALTEAAQSRLTYIAGARDDLIRFRYDRPASSVFEAFPEPIALRPFSQLPDCATSEIASDVEAIVERLETAGYSAYFVDLTRPEIGVPVCFAFVPGLGEAHRV